MDSIFIAAENIADDYMTSEIHHPGWVLIPQSTFEDIRDSVERYKDGLNENKRSKAVEEYRG